MKKLLFIALVLPAQFLIAQSKEGTITYELQVDLHRRIPAENAEMLAMVPQFRKSKYVLQYSNGESVFKSKAEEPDIADQDNGSGGHVMIKVGGSPDDVAYKNLTLHKVAELREFMGTNYLIEGDMKSMTWKIEEGTRAILGYTCKQASTKNTQGMDVVAWYTDQISTNSGPQQYGGLPGMILATDTNKGEYVFTAIAIDGKVSNKEIKAPAKGKKVTPDEFAKIQKDAMGNNNGFRIVTN